MAWTVLLLQLFSTCKTNISKIFQNNDDYYFSDALQLPFRPMGPNDDHMQAYAVPPPARNFIFKGVMILLKKKSI